MMNGFEKTHELLKNPRDINQDEFLMLMWMFHITPERFWKQRLFHEDDLNALDVFQSITELSKLEGKRRNVRISPMFDTHQQRIKMCILYVGKKTMEPFFVWTEAEEEVALSLNWDFSLYADDFCTQMLKDEE